MIQFTLIDVFLFFLAGMIIGAWIFRISLNLEESEDK